MKPTLVLIAVLLALTLAPAPAQARGEYVDQEYGFSIRVMPDWSQTPTQPGEQTEVAKWKDDRKGDFATLSIYRFQTGSGEVTPGGEDGMPARPNYGGWGLPDNAADYLKALFDRQKQMIERNAQMRSVELEDEIPDYPEPKELEFGEAVGELYLLEFEGITRMRFPGEFWAAGICRGDSEEYLILYCCPGNQARKMKGPIVKSIRSFRLPGEAKEATEKDPEKMGRATVDEDELLDPEKRARIKSELVGDWRYIDTPHYIVIYNCDRGLAEYIAKRVEYMRVNAFEKVFPPVAPIEDCMVIRVCKAMDDYHHYGGPGGSAGYWSSGHDELVFPDLAQSKKPDVKTVGVMHHEGFHQYINYALLRHDPPVWFNEGFAEYFFCIDYKNWSEKRLKFEKRHPMRYSTVKSAMGMGTLIPIKDFIKMSQRQYYANAQHCYSQGWAFATWLKNYTRNKRYQQIPEIFFQEAQKAFLEAQEGGGGDELDIPEELKDQLPPGFGRGGGGYVNPRAVFQKALDKAFEGIDLDQLNEDFLKGLKRHM